MHRLGILAVLLLGLLAPAGCSSSPPVTESGPTIRVKLLGAQEQVTVAASASPIFTSSGENSPRRLDFPGNAAVPVTLSPGGWRVGNATFNTGELTVNPAFIGSVSLKTTVLLLRLRHQLTVTRGSQTRLMLCEETVAVSAAGSEQPTELSPHETRALLGAEATRNMPQVIRDRHLQQALDALPGWQSQLEAIARQRAQTLLQDHRRVREAAEAKGSYQVTASLPVDVMGVYVLVPAATGA